MGVGVALAGRLLSDDATSRVAILPLEFPDCAKKLAIKFAKKYVSKIHREKRIEPPKAQSSHCIF
jgi:hypothetical protein